MLEKRIAVWAQRIYSDWSIGKVGGMTMPFVYSNSHFIILIISVAVSQTVRSTTNLFKNYSR